MIEKGLERKCKDLVESLGGRMLKLIPSAETGVPDRLVILPDGHICFVELKRPGGGGSLRPKQELWRRRLLDLGCHVEVIDNFEDFKARVVGLP